MDEHGIRQLRLMTVPDWKERLLELLFDPEVRTYDRGLFEYDAKSVMPMCSRIWMEISQGWFALRKPSRISVEIMRCCVTHTR